MLVLGLDTSTDVLCLSLADGENCLGCFTLSGVPNKRPREHSERILPALDSLLSLHGFKPTDLGGIAVVSGPGGFTGIRTGLAVAKSVAQALSIPIVGLCSLELLARAFPCDGLVSPLIDARRGEVFAALFRNGNVQSELLIEPKLWHLEEWLLELARFPEEIRLIGEGAIRYREDILKTPSRLPVAFGYSGEQAALLGARKILRGETDDPLSLIPAYLRIPTMVANWQKRQAAR